MSKMLTVTTPTLSIAVEESGPADGRPVILLHGFCYDPRTFDAAATVLASEGWRVIVPYLRGFGPTRFLSADTPRSGQQAVLGQDLLDMMNAMQIPRAVLAGYNWGGRAACIVAALWPERVSGLMSGCGYNLLDVAGQATPLPVEIEHRFWYNYYFHTPRGKAGLELDRRGICRSLWRQWSPKWNFDEATFERTAVSFDNPDFVDVVIHSYRHRFGYAPGIPSFEPMEEILAKAPAIGVPTIVLHGADDWIDPPDETVMHGMFSSNFTGFYDRRIIPAAGHNLPQEQPGALVQAICDLGRFE